MRDCKLAKGVEEVHAHLPSLRSVYRWIKHRNNLILRKPTCMEIARIRASTKENILNFFNIYQIDNLQYNYRKELIV
jgi:hypothetical protein